MSGGDFETEDMRDYFAALASDDDVKQALVWLGHNSGALNGLGDPMLRNAAARYACADAMLRVRALAAPAGTIPVNVKTLQAWALALSQGDTRPRADIERVLQLWGHPTRSPE